MTGRYPHNTHVETNRDAQALDQRTTVQYYLQRAGYLTAMSGKYLNSWPELLKDPPYFDRFAAIDDARYDRHIYYGFNVNVDGGVRHIGDRVYSVDYTADQAIRFLRDLHAGHPDRPWFLYVAPFAPHFPNIPEPRFAEAAEPPWRGDRGVAERDLGDKPHYVRARAIPLHRRLRAATKARRKQLRTLMSDDVLVRRIFDELRRSGELQNTLAFYMSDNGFMWGEHRLESKLKPYTRSVKVPFFVRWPGHVRAGSVSRRIVANIDIAPTILRVADLPHPNAPLDGRSLIDVAGLLHPPERSRLLFEYFHPVRLHPTTVPSWASFYAHGYQYTEYYAHSGRPLFRDYYDQRTDPGELHNLLAQPAGTTCWPAPAAAVLAGTCPASRAATRAHLLGTPLPVNPAVQPEPCAARSASS